MSNELLAMRDLVDAQFETSDSRRIGRVDDAEAEWRPDGSLVLTNLVTGPQALAGRLWPPLKSVVRFVLRDRFDHCIALDEVEKIEEKTVHLRGRAEDYPQSGADRWIADHILCFVPGSGRPR